MNLDTVGDGLGWSCDALISLAHAIRGIAGRADTTSGQLEGVARNLSRRQVERTGDCEIAARMPARIRVGDGGHPGTTTSTGITFATAPQLA